MNAQVRVRSLAKLNLDLRVLHKRPDGYHELRTIFQTISLGDTIDIEYARGRTRIDIKSNLNIPDNLVVKAADSILKATGATGHIRFHLRKRIPLGAGLGGGSSNAAAVLLALPVLIRKAAPMEKLMELAGALGSDVPFFLEGGTAVGMGRGTELYPIDDAPNLAAVLIAPGIHVSTTEAYRALDRKLTNDVPSRIINSFQSVARRIADACPAAEWGSINDFESVVFRQHPQLKSIQGKLQKLGARPALMSGSGSTIFGIFGSRELRDRAVEAVGKEFGKEKVYPVTMVSRSRYRALWWRQLAAHVNSKLWPPQSRYAR